MRMTELLPLSDQSIANAAGILRGGVSGEAPNTPAASAAVGPVSAGCTSLVDGVGSTLSGVG